MDQGTFDDVLADSEPEEWRPIAGYEGLYDVSSLGRVRSLPRMRSDGVAHVRGRFMKLQPNKRSGYFYVTLTRNGVQDKTTVHPIVAEAFHRPPKPGEVTRHLDGNPQNNVPSNLKWGSQSENGHDRTEHGRNANANKTHCDSGHEYTEANTIRSPDGRTRECRKCSNARSLARARRLRADGVPCSEPGCSRPRIIMSTGLCSACYRRKRRAERRAGREVA